MKHSVALYQGCGFLFEFELCNHCKSPFSSGLVFPVFRIRCPRFTLYARSTEQTAMTYISLGSVKGMKITNIFLCRICGMFERFQCLSNSYTLSIRGKSKPPLLF